MSVKSPRTAFSLALAFLVSAGLGAVMAQETSTPKDEAVAAIEASAPVAVAPAVEAALIETQMISLVAAFPKNAAANGRVFRARKMSLAPGARSAPLSAPMSPSIYYVTAGEVVETGADGRREARSLHMAAAVSGAAEIVLENNSSAVAEIVLVDIVPEQ